jgi:hypothetical protein
MRTGRRLATAIAAHPKLAYLAIAHTPHGWKAFRDFTRGTALLPELVGRWPITTTSRPRRRPLDWSALLSLPIKT